ncbi:MAG TPA: hypothetical protein DD438_03565, partial [Verrucomicrobiales bacterium]|nr:hypothetical protein [Verrucomicrobiales bacterium]
AALIHSLQFVENDGAGEWRSFIPEDQAGTHRSVSAEAEREEGELGASSSAPDGEAMTLKALEEIVGRLQELNAANSELRNTNAYLQEQLRETNRDLNELQFRVDTHSESFRPLRVSSNEASLLWNSISPGGNLHPLLPPKK